MPLKVNAGSSTVPSNHFDKHRCERVFQVVRGRIVARRANEHPTVHLAGEQRDAIALPPFVDVDARATEVTEQGHAASDSWSSAILRITPKRVLHLVVGPDL